MTAYIISIGLIGLTVFTIYWLAGVLANYFDPYDYGDE
jgi:hypothetical protein